MKRKKIMVITADPKTLMCHRSELLEHWASQGLEIVALAHGTNTAAEAYMRSIGGKLINLPLERNKLNPLADFKTLRSLVEVMKREQPDAVFAYTVKCVGYSGLAAKWAGVAEFYPLICGLGFAFGKGRGLKQKLAQLATRWLLKASLKNASHVFLQNEDDQQQMLAEGVLPAYISNNVLPGSGVDIQKYKPMAAQTDAANLGSVKFLFVSRLLKSKGAADFAKAAHTLRRTHPHWEFHMVGGLDAGPDGVSAEEVKTWQNHGDVHWHGEVSNVLPYLQQCHAVVLPSTYREGVPRSLLEAMAAGRPLITTDAIGCRNTVKLTTYGEAQRQANELVREGENGFLILPGSQPALEAAMSRLGSNAALQTSMGQHSRELAVSEFRVELVIQKTCEAMYLLRPQGTEDRLFDYADLIHCVPDATLTA